MVKFNLSVDLGFTNILSEQVSAKLSLPLISRIPRPGNNVQIISQ